MIGRVETDGKHLRLGSSRFVVKGVTYGSYRPRSDGARFPEPARIRSDLEAVAAMGLNTVRTYEAPPSDLLEVAAELELKVFVGLDYADWRYEPFPGRTTGRRVTEAGRAAVDALFERIDDPGVILAVSVGNDVPLDLVRVHGQRAVEDTLATLIDRVHSIEPTMPATYTHGLDTAFLRVDGQDLAAFNIAVDQAEQLGTVIDHLQMVAGYRPVVLGELGVASGNHGDGVQAAILARQLAVIDRSGCAGATVSSWADDAPEQARCDRRPRIGIVDADRRPKPAAAAVETWADTSLKDLKVQWPRLTAVVCAHNEIENIEGCLTSLERSDYPDLEVVVCNDGSTDDTLERARAYPYVVLDLPHGGLSRARNRGWFEATGELVAFLDADAVCHPQWPWFLALAFDDPTVDAVGGPNLSYPDAGPMERAVARLPGTGGTVLVDGNAHDHFTGCNMAFRREVLAEIEGFDVAFTAAGDDVDLCWKILDTGRRIRFAPAAQVRHHRPATLGGFLRQQVGYGRAEKMLSGAHPRRFDRAGSGRWFELLSEPRRLAATLMPTLTVIGLVALLASVVEERLLAAVAVSVLAIIGYGLTLAATVELDGVDPAPLRVRLLHGALGVLQPLARMVGRMTTSRYVPSPPEGAGWDGDHAHWLDDLERRLLRGCLSVSRLGADSRWDLEVRCGLMIRLMVVTGVAWRWTPHLRTAVRPRPHLFPALAALVAGMLWSPMAAALVASALIGELAYEVINLRRAQMIVLDSMAGALPPVDDEVLSAAPVE